MMRHPARLAAAAGAAAALLALEACGARSGTVPQPFPGAGRVGGAPAAAPDAADRPGAAPARPPGRATRPPDAADRAPARQAVTATARALIGSPYVWGGRTPAGFDCSGFIQYVYAQHGVPLPRVAARQYRVGAVVRPADLRPGDLVFFSTIAPGPSHVGLALGNGEFVHAPNERGRVRVERLDQRYWRRRFLGARRILAPDAAGAPEAVPPAPPPPTTVQAAVQRRPAPRPAAFPRSAAPPPAARPADTARRPPPAAPAARPAPVPAAAPDDAGADADDARAPRPRPPIRLPGAF